jgi:hypothetical protein
MDPRALSTAVRVDLEATLAVGGYAGRPGSPALRDLRVRRHLGLGFTIPSPFPTSGTVWRPTRNIRHRVAAHPMPRGVPSPSGALGPRPSTRDLAPSSLAASSLWAAQPPHIAAATAAAATSCYSRPHHRTQVIGLESTCATVPIPPPSSPGVRLLLCRASPPSASDCPYPPLPTPPSSLPSKCIGNSRCGGLEWRARQDAVVASCKQQLFLL